MLPLSVGDALFTKTQQRVLSLLFGKPDSRFYTNEIVRAVAMGKGTVCRELERLVSAGIVVQSRSGNQLYYQASRASPVYTDLLGLVRKTFGVADVLREALQPIWEQLDLAFIYGSLAKSNDRAYSDIDVMLVSKGLSLGDTMSPLLSAEKTLHRTINPTIYTMKDMQTRLKAGNSFLSRVLEQPKLWVKGSEDDIDDIGKSDQ